MSKYNAYARDLDTAFKEARSKCIDAINKLHEAQAAHEKAQANFTERYVGERGVLRAKTSSMLKEAQENFISTYKTAWADFFSIRDKLSRSLANEIDNDYKLDPAMIDSSALTLINSGVCNAKELAEIAEKFANNNSMKRYISGVAYIKAESNSISKEEKDEYIRVAKSIDPTAIAAKIKANWETLNECANKFSASHRGTEHIQNHADYVASMLHHWDDVASNVDNF